MRRYRYLIASGLIAAAAPAFAGEEILYRPEPEWVDPAELPPADSAPGKPLRLIESQVRLDGGTVWEFRQMAVALETPEALSQLGTITANWLPDKGDLIVHSIELVRDGETLDVLGDGAKFEVLRREQQLEQRMLDGGLTATLAVPGLRIGDTMRVAYSITKRDQTLDDEMEWSASLPAEPLPLAAGRIIASWPSDAQLSHKAIGLGSEVTVSESGDRTSLTIEMPVAEPEEMPLDAPARFRIPPTIQIGSFDSWQEVSATIAPYYDPQGTIAPGGAIASEVEEIRKASADPLARAALAVQLVQDEVGYLMNGLDGGNYLPQSPAETWEKRFGDCKAKSLLLLAMLRELDISAELVLARIEGGDALPKMLPLPGNFDHVIVRAEIDGRPYWLDGTDAGTRLATIGAVPRFGHVLPLRPEGATLEAIGMRPQPVPDRIVQLTVDQRAGVDVPAPFDLEMIVTGQIAAAFRALTEMEDSEQKDQAIYGTVAALVGPHQQVDKSIIYDDDRGTATISVDGLMTTPWEMEDGRYRLELPYQPASNFGFDIDRARTEWRDLPVIVNGPLFWRSEIEWLLPESGDGFTVRGQPDFESEIGGNAIVSSGGIEAGRFTLVQDLRSTAWEIPASELAGAKRETVRMKRQLPALVAPADIRRSWDYRGGDRQLLDKIEDIYTELIGQEEEDSADAYLNRAAFRAGTGDWSGALADLDIAVQRQPSAYSHFQRAQAKRQTGDLEGALADLETAERLEPETADYFSQVEILGELKRGEQAIAVAEESALVATDPEWGDIQLAYAEGWAGRHASGLERLQGIAETAPPGSQAFNALCWYSGVWDLATRSTLPVCLKAIEQSAGGAAALDSRAVVLLRLGRKEEALADLDKALAASPDEQGARYMRGIVRLALGDKGGREDIAIALAAQPALEATYSAYGLAPPKR